MSWFQLLMAILGSGAVTALITGAFNNIGIKQTNKLNQQRFDNDKKLAENAAKLEKDKTAAQDLYRIIKGGLTVLPFIQEAFTESDDNELSYKKFAYRLVDDINQDNLKSIKSDLDKFISNLITGAKDKINDHKLEDYKVVDYFLGLIISDISQHKEDYVDFKARYITSSYKHSASGWDNTGLNYSFDIKKLNSDIEFVNNILNLHMEPIIISKNE